MATETQIREICGMSATVPSSSVITRWQTLIRAIIYKFNPDPDADVADLIITNRIGLLYWNMKQSSRGPNQAQQKFMIEPLSDAEKSLLDTNQYYGSIPMDGNQTYYNGRR